MPMVLQDILNDYEHGLRQGRDDAQQKGFAATPQARRNFYYDIKYVRDLKVQQASAYDLIYACVFNRDRHLWLMSVELAVTITVTLEKADVLNGVYADFEELYDRIRGLIGSIRGVGDVTVYDITVRIGFVVGVYPEKYVYIHGKLRESARKLLGVNRLPAIRVPITIFVDILINVTAIFIEDFLCAKHDDLMAANFVLGKLPATGTETINYFFK